MASGKRLSSDAGAAGFCLQVSANRWTTRCMLVHPSRSCRREWLVARSERLALQLPRPLSCCREVEQRATDTAFCKRLGAVVVFAAKMLRSSLPRQPLAEEPAEAAERQPQQQGAQQQGAQQEAQQEAQQQAQPSGTILAPAEPAEVPAAAGAAAGAAAEQPPPKPCGTRAPRLLGMVQDKLLAGKWVGQVEGWNREMLDFVQVGQGLDQALLELANGASQHAHCTRRSI